jgi:arylsulfatase A-like enzyme
MPTLLDYVGVANPQAKELPGRSFAESLRGGSAGSSEQVVVFDEYGPVRMIRTKEWKYVHRYSCGTNELYHLANDPGEQSNLCGKPEWRKMEDELRGRLEEWFSRYADPDRDGAKEKVTGAGQLGLCGKYADLEEPFSKSGVENMQDK